MIFWKVFKTVQRREAQPYILSLVVFCAYCAEEATVQIPATPADVCLTHAVEFWTQLMALVKERSDPAEKPDTLCPCESCNQLAASNRRPRRAETEGPPPSQSDSAQISQAS